MKLAETTETPPSPTLMAVEVVFEVFAQQHIVYCDNSVESLGKAKAMVQDIWETAHVLTADVTEVSRAEYEKYFYNMGQSKRVTN